MIEKEIEKSLNQVMNYTEKRINDLFINTNLGWTELNIGDEVYFKTYDDIEDSFIISKGEILEIITTDKKVLNKPDNNLVSDGWHIERYVTYKVRWNGNTMIIDQRYVYVNKLQATLAAIHNTIKSYFNE